MSIALSIIDLVSDQAEKAGAKRVKELELDIGTMSGIEVDSLKFSLDAAIRDTLLASSLIKINVIKAVSECRYCGHLFEPVSFITPCPECNELSAELIRGKELQVRSILIE